MIVSPANSLERRLSSWVLTPVLWKGQAVAEESLLDGRDEAPEREDHENGDDAPDDALFCLLLLLRIPRRHNELHHAPEKEKQKECERYRKSHDLCRRVDEVGKGFLSEGNGRK